MSGMAHVPNKMLISIFIVTMVLQAAHSFKAVLVNGSITISDFDKACESSGFIPGEKKNETKNSTEEFDSLTSMMETLCPYVSFYPAKASPDIVLTPATKMVSIAVIPAISDKYSTTTKPIPATSKLNVTAVKINDISTIKYITTAALLTESYKNNTATEATPSKLYETTIKIDDPSIEENTTIADLVVKLNKGNNITTEASLSASKLNGTTEKIDDPSTKKYTPFAALLTESDKDKTTTETTPTAFKLNETTRTMDDPSETTIKIDDSFTKKYATIADLVIKSDIDNATTKATVEMDYTTTKNNATTLVFTIKSDKDDMTTEATPSTILLNETTEKKYNTTTTENTARAVVIESHEDNSIEVVPAILYPDGNVTLRLFINKSTDTTPEFVSTDKYISSYEGSGDDSLENWIPELNNSNYTSDEFIIPLHYTAIEKGIHYEDDDNTHSKEIDRSGRDDSNEQENMNSDDAHFSFNDGNDDNSVHISPEVSTYETASSKYYTERETNVTYEEETQENEHKDNTSDKNDGTRTYVHDTASVDARRKIVVLVFVSVLLFFGLIWGVRFLYLYFTGKGKYVLPQEEEDNNDIELGEHSQ